MQAKITEEPLRGCSVSHLLCSRGVDPRSWSPSSWSSGSEAEKQSSFAARRTAANSTVEMERQGGSGKKMVAWRDEEPPPSERAWR